MWLRSFLLIGVMLVLLVAVPALQAETVEEFPEIAFPQTGQFEVLVTLGQDPLLVSQGKFSTLSRIYMTYILAPQATPPEEIGELVTYDGSSYIRQNDDPQWYIDSQADVQIDPPTDEELAEAQAMLDELASELIITRLDTVTVSGVATTHYQIVSREGEGVDRASKIDMWVGQQDNYVYQLQLTLTSEEDASQVEGIFVLRFFDLNNPNIQVIVPPNALPVPENGLNSVGNTFSVHTLQNMLGSVARLSTR